MNSKRIFLGPAIGIAATFLITNAFLLRHFGVRVQNDGVWYMEMGRRMAHGRPLYGEYDGYLGYIGLISLFVRAGAGAEGVVALQYLIAAFSVWVMYDLGKELWNPRAGLLAAFLLSANVDALSDHSYIATESIYISGGIIWIWLLHRAVTRRGSWIAGATLATLYLAFHRPFGMFLVPVAVYHLMRIAVEDWRKRIAWFFSALVLTAGIASLSPYVRGRVERTPHYERGEVIEGYPALAVKMPQELGTPGEKLHATASYLRRHPMATVRLIGVRLGVEVMHTRPYFSQVHNLLIILFYFPLYAFALKGALTHWKNPTVRLICAAMAANLVPVGLIFASWEGRYLLYLVPEITLLAAGASLGKGEAIAIGSDRSR